MKIKFFGIDGFNRAVFKGEDGYYYGDIEHLFEITASEIDVLKAIDVNDLTYFGSRFGCEPMGTPPGIELEIELN